MKITYLTSVTREWDLRLEQEKKRVENRLGYSIYLSWITLDQQILMKFALRDLDN